MNFISVLIMFGLVSVIILIVVLFLLTLQNALKQVDESRREVQPGNVWLMFIPIFNLIYPFILYPKISDSIKAEYNARGLQSDGNFSKGLGITFAVLGLVGFIPILGSLASIANFVIWIVFWVKIAGYKNVLTSNNVNSAILDIEA